MASMEKLVRLMRELEDRLVVCMRCGMCQSVCPVFEQTGREADVTRGKLALLSGLMESMIDDPAGVYKRLDKCLLCGSCAANCPSGVDVQEIFFKARAILTGYMGLPTAKKLIFRGLLANPEIFDRMAQLGARLQKIFTHPVNEIVGTSCARILSPLLQGRHFRTLAPVPFHGQVPYLDKQGSSAHPKVALFTGCLIDKMFPDIAHSTIKVLEHFDVGVFVPENQGCCGIPALASGDLSTFQKLLSHNLSRFEAGRFDLLVTACATCTSTIHEIWPKMADSDKKEAATALASRTMDINRFLVEKVGIVKAKGDRKHARNVTYHDPCHLKKGLNVFKEPRVLIEATNTYRLTEMAEPDWCCGMGGSFNLQYYDISREIGKKKARQIIDTGAQILATGCPACMIQISDMLSRAGARVAIRHPVQLYAESLEE